MKIQGPNFNFYFFTVLLWLALGTNAVILWLAFCLAFSAIAVIYLHFCQEIPQ